MSEVSGVYIKSKRPGGHFRAGQKHPEEETYYPIGNFDADKLQALLSDPALEVRLNGTDGKDVAKAAARTAAKKVKAKK